MIPVPPHFVDNDVWYLTSHKGVISYDNRCLSGLSFDNLERVKKYIEWDLREDLDMQRVVPYGMPDFITMMCSPII